MPKNLTFINLDIDSYDLEIINQILDSGFKPDIVSIEINEKIPPPIYFSVTYDQKSLLEGRPFLWMFISCCQRSFHVP